MTLNTLAYSKHLQEAGDVDRKAAEAHAEAMAQFVIADLATKADLTALGHELTIKLYAVAAVVIGAIAALVKFL